VSRIPPDLARRLDRLSVAAHRFHRFAHHPLCAEYESEVLRFGRARLCRGCAMAATGAALGLAAGSIAPRLPLPWLGAPALLGTLCTAFLLRRPLVPPPPAEGTLEAKALSQAHRIPAPRSKVPTRLLPCALLAFGIAQGLRLGPPWGWALAALALLEATAAAAAYRRRGPQRGPCATCPERFAMHRCRGVREILRRERAFQRLSGRLIARAQERSGTMS
jgi:hypothetical protein